MNVVPETRHAMSNGHCSLQLGVWGGFQPPAVPGQSTDGGPRGKNQETLEILQFTIAKKPNIHSRVPFTPNYNFMNFVD